jgi:hypothetical protein
MRHAGLSPESGQCGHSHWADVLPRSQERACGPATGNCCFIDILEQQTGAKITQHVNSNTQQQKRKKIGTITF